MIFYLRIVIISTESTWLVGWFSIKIINWCYQIIPVVIICYLIFTIYIIGIVCIYISPIIYIIDICTKIYMIGRLGYTTRYITYIVHRRTKSLGHPDSVFQETIYIWFGGGTILDLWFIYHKRSVVDPTAIVTLTEENAHTLGNIAAILWWVGDIWWPWHNPNINCQFRGRGCPSITINRSLVLYNSNHLTDYLPRSNPPITRYTPIFLHFSFVLVKGGQFHFIQLLAASLVKVGKSW